jgi:hypothetical protein
VPPSAAGHDRPEIAVFVRPFVPDAYAVLFQIGDVGVALQEPEQLVDDGFHMQLLGGDERETFRQIEAHLMAEDRQRADARPVALLKALFQDQFHQIVILAHGKRHDGFKVNLTASEARVSVFARMTFLCAQLPCELSHLRLPQRLVDAALPSGPVERKRSTTSPGPAIPACRKALPHPLGFVADTTSALPDPASAQNMPKGVEKRLISEAAGRIGPSGSLSIACPAKE